MKIVVIGGSGLIGAKVVESLTKLGHEAFSASRRSGVNTVTGEGLDDALHGADVVVDVSDSPSFDPLALQEFYVTSAKNLVAAAAKVKVKNFVVLSVVGVGRGGEGPYFAAKLAQESEIKQSKLPYTVVQATQFYEFLATIANFSTVDGKVVLPETQMQPLSADDAAEAVVQAAVSQPVNGTIEIGGPEKSTMAHMVARYLNAVGDKREVITYADGTYFGTKVGTDSIVPSVGGKSTPTRFDDWIKTAYAVK